MQLCCLIDTVKWSNSVSGIPVGMAAPAGASGILYWLTAETGQTSPPPNSGIVYCRPPISCQGQTGQVYWLHSRIKCSKPHTLQHCNQLKSFCVWLLMDKLSFFRKYSTCIHFLTHI